MDIMDTFKVDLASLQSRGPLLRQDALRPGDVLLIKGNSSFSSLIVSVTKGEYSHAAIWIPGGDEKIESLLLAESDTAGVGFTFLMPMSLHTGNVYESESVFEIPDNPRKWVLLRHPDSENIEPARMRHASKDLQKDDFYKTYSALPRLLEAVTLRKSYHAIANAVAQAIETCRSDKGTRGVFCSELVATFFSKLGLELFSDGREPHTISPNDLLLPECRLEVVENAFVDMKNLPSETYAYASLTQNRNKDLYLRGMISRRGISDKMTENVNDLMGDLRKSTLVIIEKQNEIAAETQRWVSEHIAYAEFWNEPEQIEILRRYALMHKYGHCLMLCLHEHDERQRFGNMPAEDIQSWNAASATLQFIANELMSRAQSGLLRNAILSGIRRARKTYRNTLPRRAQLAKFKRTRFKMSKAWQKHKRDDSAYREFSHRLLQTDTLSEQAQIYIHEVTQLALNLLINEIATEKIE